MTVDNSDCPICGRDSCEDHLSQDVVDPITFFRSNGVNVFPVRPGAKEPAVPRGTSWKQWTGSVQFPYGVELGTLIVLDGDSSAAAEWITTHCPATPFAVTTGPYHDQTDPGRGMHFYYRAPSISTPAFIHRDGFTIEARRAGQYVLGPGSRHPSGLVYTAAPWSWRWNDIPIFPADFVFDDRPPEMQDAARYGDGRYEFPAVVTAGERHHELFRQLRSWRHILERDEAYEAIVNMNLAFCRPPLPEDEAFKKWFHQSWEQRDRPFPDQPPLHGLIGLRGLY